MNAPFVTWADDERNVVRNEYDDPMQANYDMINL